jgi:CubicO group peptidase (beta-lactamase class C family)
MSDVQDLVAGVVDELVGSGAERGLQVAAYVDGQPVVDVAAGVADTRTGRPVRPETLFFNWSIGKGVTATLLHRLVDAGALRHDTRVAEVWPEFARHGKQAVTVRQVLDHTAGVPGLPAGTTVDALCSWEAMVAALEDARPWWEPGVKVGYHAYTFGFLAGEVVRRVTGRAPGDLLGALTAEIGHPGEIRYGIPTGEAVVLAVLEDAPAYTPSGPAATPPALLPTAALGNDPRVLAADVPATAKVTARALARMYAGWLGPVDGRRVVSPERLAEATAVSSAGPDQVYGNPCRWSLGFVLGPPWDDPASPRVFGMPGAGGGWAGADPDRGVAVAVTRTVMSADFATARRLAGAVLTAVRGGR